MNYTNHNITDEVYHQPQLLNQHHQSLNSLVSTNNSMLPAPTSCTNRRNNYEKPREACTGCFTITDSVLYSIYLCHGCIKLYLAEWKKIISKNLQVFVQKDIDQSIAHILREGFWRETFLKLAICLKIQKKQKFRK